MHFHWSLNASKNRWSLWTVKLLKPNWSTKVAQNKKKTEDSTRENWTFISYVNRIWKLKTVHFQSTSVGFRKDQQLRPDSVKNYRKNRLQNYSKMQHKLYYFALMRKDIIFILILLISHTPCCLFKNEILDGKTLFSRFVFNKWG